MEINSILLKQILKYLSQIPTIHNENAIEIPLNGDKNGWFVLIHCVVDNSNHFY